MIATLTSVHTSRSSTVKTPTPGPLLPLASFLIFLNESANCEADLPTVSTLKYRLLHSTTMCSRLLGYALGTSAGLVGTRVALNLSRSA